MCRLGVAERDGMGRKGGIFCDRGESKRAIGANLEPEIVGETAHGPPGVDFADRMPGQAVGSGMEEGINADRAVVAVLLEEVRESQENLLFGGRKNDIRDQPGLFGG